MPEYLSTQNHLSPTPRRGRFYVLAGILFLFVIFLRTAIAEWVELLWFRSLNYGAVFRTSLVFESVVFFISAVTTFAILYGAFYFIRRSHDADLPTTRAIIIGGRDVNFSVAPILRVISLVASAGIAIATGFTMMAQWATFALFWCAPAATGPVADPIFHRSVNFYLFTLPAWRILDGWLLTLAFATCAVAVLFLVITSGTRSLGARRLSLAPSPSRGLSVTAAFLLLAIALTVYVQRYELLFDHHTLFDGIDYTGAHIMARGLLLVVAALILGVFIAAVNAVRDSRLSVIVIAALPGVVTYVALGVVSWYVGNFIVKPNQLVREEPFIAHNIEMTRQAFGLDRFSQSEFPAETSLEAADANGNQPTLQNIRLWDWHALQDTLRQIQEIRTYYDFPDVDIDRYMIDGTLRQVMLAARELNVDKLPVSSRNWVNEKLIYTHGYGVTMNPVNGFTPEGLPNLLLSNMPVQSTVPGIKVVRPELYFGELTDTDVYVKTRQQEFDYPQGQANNVTSYQGTGGIPIGGFLHRLLLAFDRSDLGTLPFSDDVTSDSRLLMHRNIRDRVARLAPFLTFDRDPYIVVGDDGRLSWIIDAYTTSDDYPYSNHYAVGNSSVNYIRNSVKVVVDAYNGTTTFYVFDPADPILSAYRRLYPTLFSDAVNMSADLRRHTRYPEDIFKLQSEVYGLYHMTRPEVFFNREDLWTVATETSNDANGQQFAQAMQPNYVVMKLPGANNSTAATSEEFVQILPFTPSNRNNLIGWIAGRSDGPAYGNTAVYNFPKTRLIDGPQQIEARIDQNAQLSGQLTLWNQQGSHVLRGSLLVIPTGRTLLYAEPIYLQAQQSPMPELRLVVLALQDKLAYGTTFQAALASLFSGEPSSLNARNPAQSISTGESRPVTNPPAGYLTKGTQDSLIAEAGRAFDDYQQLTAAGKLGEAGRQLEHLRSLLNQLKAQQDKR